MASRAPPNVTRLIQKNDAHAHAKQHANSLARGDIVGKWHEKDLQNQGRRDMASIRHTDFASLPQPGAVSSTVESTTGKIAKELEAGKEAVQLQRRARLQELYKREALQHEAELNALGLALSKPRE